MHHLHEFKIFLNTKKKKNLIPKATCRGQKPCSIYYISKKRRWTRKDQLNDSNTCDSHSNTRIQFHFASFFFLSLHLLWFVCWCCIYKFTIQTTLAQNLWACFVFRWALCTYPISSDCEKFCGKQLTENAFRIVCFILFSVNSDYVYWARVLTHSQLAI